ncbi:MAG: ABC transporter ATP-binding protein [Elusimicrobia bacterium]|nr:ABC transporter ATP-binding protein [Elusimicrobiota bacterium]
MLEAEGISKSFGAFKALEGAALDVRPREILGIIGPNGAGKTTLLESLAGLVPVDAGEVRSHGRALAPHRRKEALFYMPDGARPFGEQTAGALIDLFADLYRAADGRKEVLIERLGLASSLRKRAEELSKGTLKRLLLAMGLLTPQQILLLDEPFDGLDPHQVRAVMALLRETREAGRSLVLSIHQLPDAERVCDRLLLLCAGKVVGFGTLDELRAKAGSAGSLEEVFFALT